MTKVQLDGAGAAELAGMLTFTGDWLTSDPTTLTSSLGKFTASTACTIGTLRTDLARFLLTSGDAAHLFGEDQP